MKIPCVCEAGTHSFNAHEMVDIIGAFQRGELMRTRYVKGAPVGVYPVCLAHADFNAGKVQTGEPCGVLTENGSHCNMPRGHRDGRHEHH